MRYLLLFALFFFSAAHADSIDDELEALKEQYRTLRKEQFNAEIEGQSSFLDNDSSYVKKMEEAEQKDNQADKLSKRISELEAKKKSLQQPPPP